MYLGWLSYAGRELINNNRVAAYTRGVTVTCGCDSLPEALGDEPYKHPAQDPAPWFEKAVPESQDFWGCVGLEITGGSASTRKTEFTDLINDGAIPGSARREAREIEVKTMLLARTEAGLSWGLSWLNAALRGSACKTGCGGDELCVLAGCPEPPPVSADADACDPSPMQPEPQRAAPAPKREGNTGTRPEPAPMPDNRRAPKPPPEPEPAPAPAPAPAPPPPEGEPPPPPAPEPAPAPPPPAPAGPPPAPQGPPPGPNPPSPDPEVAKVIYLVGRELNVSGKAMLAAFEGALVESSCRNLDHGDRDSVGVFQQRPSAKTWGTVEECLNVNHAAHKFFEKTVKNDQKHPEFSAGQLAQATQSSAYPDRYDKREGEAQQLLDDTARANGGGGGAPTPAPPPAPPRPEAKPEPLPPPAPAPQPSPLPDTGGKHDTERPPPGSGHTDTNHPDQDTHEWDPQTAAHDMVRRLYDVALSEFGGDEERARLNGAWTSTVTFTLKAGNPAWYYSPRTLVDTRQTTTAPAVVTDVIPDYRIDAVARCPEPVDCLAQSPYLQNRGPWGDEPFPGSNPADPVWRDPGFPIGAFNAKRAVYLSPGSMTPGWLERVPIIDVYSGHQDVHRVTIRFYANPRGGQPRELDPCDACTEITLPWIPARSKVRMDGRTQRVEVTCPDKHVMTSDVVLYGPLGGLLEWPVFDCGQPMIIEMLAQDGTLAPDAWYRFQWAAKADAI